MTLHKNYSEYREYYNTEARKVVERFFAPDIEYFGYRF